MNRLRRTAAAASLAAAAWVSAHASAAEQRGDRPHDFSLSPKLPVYAQESRGEARGPLMRLLDQAGVGDALDDARIRLYGWAEAGITHNFEDPAGDLNLGRVFDIEHDDPTFNQLDLNIERPVQLADDTWDL